jgi:uncharacterized phage-associated protein
MSTCFDVAKYILEKQGQMTAMKLQKIVYYAQAWSLVWDEAPLFNEHIEAWISGPVIPGLYDYHRGKYYVNAIDILSGNSTDLSENQKDTIDHVLSYYGDKSSKWLSDLTHLEDPWKNARRGLAAEERGNNEISLASMAEYYSSILPNSDSKAA